MKHLLLVDICVHRCRYMKHLLLVDISVDICMHRCRYMISSRYISRYLLWHINCPKLVSPGWVVAGLLIYIVRLASTCCHWPADTRPDHPQLDTTSSAHHYLSTLLITIHWYHTRYSLILTTIQYMRCKSVETKRIITLHWFWTVSSVPPLKLYYHWKLTRVDAVVMDRWCNGPLVVWAFILYSDFTTFFTLIYLK